MERRPHGKQGDTRWRMKLRQLLYEVRRNDKTRNHLTACSPIVRAKTARVRPENAHRALSYAPGYVAFPFQDPRPNAAVNPHEPGEIYNAHVVIGQKRFDKVNTVFDSVAYRGDERELVARNVKHGDGLTTLEHHRIGMGKSLPEIGDIVSSSSHSSSEILASGCRLAYSRMVRGLMICIANLEDADCRCHYGNSMARCQDMLKNGWRGLDKPDFV